MVSEGPRPTTIWMCGNCVLRVCEADKQPESLVCDLILTRTLGP